MPHSIPNLDDRLVKGSNVAMTYFRINSYASECERTFFLEKPRGEDLNHFKHMMEARKIALSLVNPDKVFWYRYSCKRIFNKARLWQ